MLCFGILLDDEAVDFTPEVRAPHCSDNIIETVGLLDVEAADFTALVTAPIPPDNTILVALLLCGSNPVSLLDSENEILRAFDDFNLLDGYMELDVDERVFPLISKGIKVGDEVTVGFESSFFSLSFSETDSGLFTLWDR